MHQQHPFSEEAWSLPANGGTNFRQDRAVRDRRSGVVTLPEFGVQYALAISENRQHDFTGRWCHLKRLVSWGRGMLPMHGGTPPCITSDYPGKHVVPFVLVALEILQ